MHTWSNNVRNRTDVGSRAALHSQRSVEPRSGEEYPISAFALIQPDDLYERLLNV